MADTIRDELLAGDVMLFSADRAIRQIPITLTTITSSKGLSADYVFITHFDDQHFIRDSAARQEEEFSSFLQGRNSLTLGLGRYFENR